MGDLKYQVCIDYKWFNLAILFSSLSLLLILNVAPCSTLFTGWMPTIFRAGRGMTLWEKAKRDPPPKKLELYSYENNPVR